MIQIRDERAADGAAREHLLDACFGEARFTKTCERLREGRLPAERLALAVEMQDRLVATVRLWNVDAGGIPALMLGPIAVDPALQGLGLGHRLMREALARAATLGHRAVILVGDAPYYARFGFTRERVGALSLPGPFAPERFLALDLVPGALDGAAGMVRATGRVLPVAGSPEAFRVAA
ncbi:GNAT family N-acetyltransferase [Methylobacterium platani]|uniref:GCN5 family acetyltransferase n=1 Tax=Methylobacterium platani TaxID=427683 RepID=A0A179S2I5_9HYPH|nr:N-acetyltransferase [Methylobacterium platani]OAS16844.1 GCN5 family acetyltransferase [Methylobacterium platani]